MADVKTKRATTVEIDKWLAQNKARIMRMDSLTRIHVAVVDCLMWYTTPNLVAWLEDHRQPVPRVHFMERLQELIVRAWEAGR